MEGMLLFILQLSPEIFHQSRMIFSQLHVQYGSYLLYFRAIAIFL